MMASSKAILSRLAQVASAGLVAATCLLGGCSDRWGYRTSLVVDGVVIGCSETEGVGKAPGGEPGQFCQETFHTCENGEVYSYSCTGESEEGLLTCECKIGDTTGEIFQLEGPCPLDRQAAVARCGWSSK